jgi:hypothetical protein
LTDGSICSESDQIIPFHSVQFHSIRRIITNPTFTSLGRIPAFRIVEEPGVESMKPPTLADHPTSIRDCNFTDIDETMTTCTPAIALAESTCEINKTTTGNCEALGARGDQWNRSAAAAPRGV